MAKHPDKIQKMYSLFKNEKRVIPFIDKDSVLGHIIHQLDKDITYIKTNDESSSKLLYNWKLAYNLKRCSLIESNSNYKLLRGYNNSNTKVLLLIMDNKVREIEVGYSDILVSDDYIIIGRKDSKVYKKDNNGIRLVYDKLENVGIVWNYYLYRYKTGEDEYRYIIAKDGGNCIELYKGNKISLEIIEYDNGYGYYITIRCKELDKVLMTLIFEMFYRKGGYTDCTDYWDKIEVTIIDGKKTYIARHCTGYYYIVDSKGHIIDNIYYRSYDDTIRGIKERVKYNTIDKNSTVERDLTDNIDIIKKTLILKEYNTSV